jgi:hypothetical protein
VNEKISNDKDRAKTITWNNIYNVEPLRIKVNIDDSEQPRAPTLDECESIIKSLLELHKQQKYQVK